MLLTENCIWTLPLFKKILLVWVLLFASLIIIGTVVP